MRYIRITLLTAIIGLLVYSGNRHQVFGSKLPALAALLDPFGGFWQNAEPKGKSPLPGLLDLPQLSQPVQIIFDDRLVPHIFAQNMADAAFAQGYITAKFRIWQMNMTTRAASGQLAAVVGEKALERDKLQRRKGMTWAAERTLQHWKQTPTEYNIIEAYAQGVNAYLSSLDPKDYPLECKLMDFTPQQWSPLHSALVFKSMAEMLSSRNDDIQASNAMRLLGDSLFQYLYPEYPPFQSPVIPVETPWNFKSAVTKSLVPANSGISETLAPFDLMPQPSPFIGSNNWALASRKSQSGYPLLCNDPHLRLTLPSIWFEIQIHTPELNAYGVSLPGIPGIIIGFNNDIAWGVTNGSQDVLDWYAVEWSKPDKSAYLFDGKERPVELRTEVIEVRGRATPVIDTVRYTTWGPVVYETEDSPYRDLAMHWVAHDPVARQDFYEVGVFMRLMSGHSYADFKDAIAHFRSPAQNFVFASKSDDIALHVGGLFPIKKPQQGRFVQDGKSSSNDWGGFIPPDQNPQVLNPARGFVSSANQHATSPDYPYYLNGYYDTYRGRMVNRLLEKQATYSVEDMKAMQNNTYGIKAEEGVKALLKNINPAALNKAQQKALQDLAQWDFRYEADVQAPTLFEQWLSASYKATFDELYLHPDSNNLLYPQIWRFIDMLGNSPQHILFDNKQTAEKEDASIIVTRSFIEWYKLNGEAYSSNELAWGKHKNTWIKHLADIPAFSVNLPDIGGTGDALNAIKPTHGPSWRMIVELGPKAKAYGVFPGGVSGNPGSSFYDTSVKVWAKGQYHELLLLDSPKDQSQHHLFSTIFQ